MFSTAVGASVGAFVRDARRKHSRNFHAQEFPSVAIANFRGNFRNLTLTRARKFLGEFPEIWIGAKLEAQMRRDRERSPGVGGMR